MLPQSTSPRPPFIPALPPRRETVGDTPGVAGSEGGVTCRRLPGGPSPLPARCGRGGGTVITRPQRVHLQRCPAQLGFAFNLCPQLVQRNFTMAGCSAGGRGTCRAEGGAAATFSPPFPACR